MIPESMRRSQPDAVRYVELVNFSPEIIGFIRIILSKYHDLGYPVSDAPSPI